MWAPTLRLDISDFVATKRGNFNPVIGPIVSALAVLILKINNGSKLTSGIAR